jgi:photosystem II stability/assembly factor-like uncharacterized protein
MHLPDPLKNSLPVLAALLLLALFSCRRETIEPGRAGEQTAPVTDDLFSVWFTSADEGFIAGGRPWVGGFLLHTVDGGQHWQLDTALRNQLECVRFDDTGQGYACGLDGLVLHRPADSRSWTVFGVDWTWYKACHFWNARRGAVVSATGFAEGGARVYGPEVFWIRDTQLTFERPLSDIWYADSLTVVACGLGWLGRSADGGRTWERLPVTGDFFEALHFPTPETGYVCGSLGTLLKTTDGGRTWQTLRDGASVWVRDRTMRTVYFTSADEGYVGGDEGLLWRTTDGGVTWTQLDGVPASLDIQGLFALADRGWAVGRNGRIFYFEF